MDHAFLGPEYSEQEIEQYVRWSKLPYRRMANLAEETADFLAADKVIGWFQGRMEFGPRALGGRSILGDPRGTEMQSVMNLKIKFRESFRPFAPIVLRERVSEYFEMRDGEDSPYMLLVAPVREAKRLDGSAMAAAAGLDKLKVLRSQVPAITHVDYSARVQTVDAERHGRLYKLMKVFEERTGCPVMINTSFNVRGEPIVCSPEHAYHCFMGTDMDVLVLENHILLKDEQPASAIPERAEYLRVIMAELTRIVNHVSAIGFLMNDLGAYFTPILYAFQERELILDIFEAVSGSRMMDCCARLST